MGPAVYVMAILGCGEASDICEPVATVPARYESAADCNAATESALQQHGDALFPVVVAQCRPVAGSAQEHVWADEVKLPAVDPSRRERVRRASYQPRERS